MPHLWATPPAPRQGFSHGQTLACCRPMTIHTSMVPNSNFRIKSGELHQTKEESPENVHEFPKKGITDDVSVATPWRPQGQPPPGSEIVDIPKACRCVPPKKELGGPIGTHLEAPGSFKPIQRGVQRGVIAVTLTRSTTTPCFTIQTLARIDALFFFFAHGTTQMLDCINPETWFLPPDQTCKQLSLRKQPRD